MAGPLRYEDALRLVLDRVVPLLPGVVALDEALGLALAEDVIALDPVPPFTNSAMDGFAVRAADTDGASAGSPARLRVAGSLAAGQTFAGELPPGTAVRIMTGAPLPAGADAVVPVERTTTAEDFLLLDRPVCKGADIRLAGEDIAGGATVLEAGTTLRPGEIGVLATLGCGELSVFPRARVAVLTTGDELVDCSERPGPGQIRDANVHALCAQVRAFGATAVPFPRVPDGKEAVEQAIRQACETADVVLSTGGISVGDFDFVKGVLEGLGAEKVFWRVAQKPGGPLGFYVLNGKPFFGIPGNPVAAMVMMEEYVRPALRKMMGHRFLFRPAAQGMLGSPWTKSHADGKLHFLRVRAELLAGEYRATLTGPQGSGILSSMIHGNALALVPEEATGMAAGEPVLLHLTDETEDH